MLYFRNKEIHALPKKEKNPLKRAHGAQTTKSPQKLSAGLSYIGFNDSSGKTAES